MINVPNWQSTSVKWDTYIDEVEAEVVVDSSGSFPKHQNQCWSLGYSPGALMTAHSLYIK